MAAIRRASCRCGQLHLTCSGEPVRISVCHCYHCQRRSGSAFAVQARFPLTAVTIAGDERVWESAGADGPGASFHFCPVCGGTVYYRARPFRGLIAVPVGAFADTSFPPPAFSVWEERRHAWVTVSGDKVEHSN